jgi:sugar/nucleoside kinase (ribokinase family)
VQIRPRARPALPRNRPPPHRRRLLYRHPGAAGTVANNLAALKCGRVALLGAIGDDGNGLELLRALQARGISTEYIHKTPMMPTFTYTKLIDEETGVEDLPRIDFLCALGVPATSNTTSSTPSRPSSTTSTSSSSPTRPRPMSAASSPAAVRKVVEDAAHTYPTKSSSSIPAAAPPNSTASSSEPNQDEAEEASRALLGRIDYPAMRRKLRAPALLVTQGAAGVTIYRPDM